MVVVAEGQSHPTTCLSARAAYVALTVTAVSLMPCLQLRLNTNGLGGVATQRCIVPDIKSLFHSVTVALNTAYPGALLGGGERAGRQPWPCRPGPLN